MPPDFLSGKARKHIEESYKNYQRYLHLCEEPSDPCWAIVLLFYSAVHLVQAHAEQKASNPKSTMIVSTNHGDRTRYIANNLKAMVVDYGELQTASEEARYNLVIYTESDVDEYHDKEFSFIVQYMAKMNISWQRVSLPAFTPR